MYFCDFNVLNLVQITAHKDWCGCYFKALRNKLEKKLLNCFLDLRHWFPTYVFEVQLREERGVLHGPQNSPLSSISPILKAPVNQLYTYIYVKH